MENYFNTEIMQIEKELTRLKTSMSKSAGVIQTITSSVDVEVPLSLNSTLTTATGSVSYRIHPLKDAIIVCTLNWYSEDVTRDYMSPRVVRNIYLRETVNDGDRIVKINGIGTQFGDYSDVQQLIDGQTVSISAKLTIRATCEFTVEAINE